MAQFKLKIILILIGILFHIMTCIEFTRYNEINLLANTQLNYDDFIKDLRVLFPGQENTYTRAQVREALAKYLYKTLVIYSPFSSFYFQKISGYNQDPSNFDQNQEDITLFLSHKAAKDFIMKTGMEQFNVDDIRFQIFSDTIPMAQTALKRPQSKNSVIVLDYANSILNHMQDYIIMIIQKKNLRFDNRDKDGKWNIEETKVKGLGGGLDVMAYFMFKLAYENDRRYALERIEQFDNFDEYLPISQY